VANHAATQRIRFRAGSLAYAVADHALAVDEAIDNSPPHRQKRGQKNARLPSGRRAKPLLELIKETLLL
jgi:hypothetical protein